MLHSQSARLTPALLGALALMGCGESAQPRVPLGDDGWGPSLRDGSFAAPEPPPPPAPRARPIAEDERVRWAHADALPTLADVGRRGPSEHDDSRYERTVRITEAQLDTYRHLTSRTVMPAGTVVVQRHHVGDADEVVLRYAMVKREGAPDAWDFAVLDQQLRVAADEQLDLCVRCHQEAPHHGLFGLPTSR